MVANIGRIVQTSTAPTRFLSQVYNSDGSEDTVYWGRTSSYTYGQANFTDMELIALPNATDSSRSKYFALWQAPDTANGGSTTYSSGTIGVLGYASAPLPLVYPYKPVTVGGNERSMDTRRFPDGNVLRVYSDQGPDYIDATGFRSDIIGQIIESQPRRRGVDYVTNLRGVHG